MWITTSQGLINSDNFGRFLVTDNSYGKTRYFAVIARPANIHPTMTEKYDGGITFEWDYQEISTCGFDVILETFDTRDDAQKYLDKLAEKLGAEVIEID